jgi:hypothetical protein
MIELALICADTFNVDEKYLDHVLGLPDDGSIFIQCCIHIHDSASPISGLSDPIIPILHQRWKSLCYRSYPILAKGILDAQSRSLDDRNTSRMRKFRRQHRSPLYEVADVLKDFAMEELETINPFTLAPWEKRVQTITDEVAAKKVEAAVRVAVSSSARNGLVGFGGATQPAFRVGQIRSD